MARHAPLTSLKQQSEINLTPLMDLTFILLITFIITFPLIEQWIPVDLPKESARTVSTDTAAMTVSVDQNGSIYIDNALITIEQLQTRMDTLSKEDPTLTVMLRADERIRYGKVVSVLKVFHDAKITKMALVTQSDD